jgi:Asp-tRNA(Asn)/Glu-tRNA(Gln) amidotransferase A subunit family amidase
MKTAEEIKKLKISWHKDPIWDIETTEGFEDHKQELLEYRKSCEAEWEKKNIERKKQEERNKPAFPSMKAKYGYEGEYLGLEEDEYGMTLRDYFAGQALAGLVIGAEINGKGESQLLPVARAAYNIADAMLEARKQ